MLTLSAVLSTALVSFIYSALQAVDDALSSAAAVKGNTSKEVDEKFERAIEVLSCYETECLPVKPASRDGRSMTVHERLSKAKGKDKSSSTKLKVLKEKFSAKVRLAHIYLPHTVLMQTCREPRTNNGNQQ
jgi:hypothetical protein